MRKITDDISQNTATDDDEFTNGNPSESLPATIVPAEWLNTIQRELVAILTAAGLVVDPNNDAQVVAGIQALVGNQGVRNYFKAIVGSAGFCTHATLAAAIADAAVTSGSRILVTENQTINSTIVISKQNLLIEFQPAVTFSKGSAGTGLNITAGGVKIHGGRFTGFSGGGDKAIAIDASADYVTIAEARFANNTTDVDDLSETANQFGNIQE